MSRGLTLLDRLRKETREVHEALESQLPLTSPDLTLDKYRDSLERFYAFYFPFETQVLPNLPEDWARLFEDRGKLSALRADLEFVGSKNLHLLVCPDFPVYESLPAMLGGLYVVEGSTLGGQLISRHVRQVLGLSEKGGLQFFSSYGAEVGSRWTAFRELLLRYSSPQHDEAIVDSAKRTFEALYRCLVETRDRLMAKTPVLRA